MCRSQNAVTTMISELLDERMLSGPQAVEQLIHKLNQLPEGVGIQYTHRSCHSIHTDRSGLAGAKLCGVFDAAALAELLRSLLWLLIERVTASQH